MGWFERHLNWSLFLGLFYIPSAAGFTIGVIVSIFMVIAGLLKFGFSRELLEYLETDIQGLGNVAAIAIAISVLVLMIIFTVRLGFWFLDRKGQSRGHVAWLVAPPFIGIALMFSTIFLGAAGIIIGAVVAFLGPIVGLIFLLILKNQGIGFGGDLGTVLAHDQGPGQWMDTLPPSVLDDRQLKELDYTPDKNIMDMVGSAEVKDIGDPKSIADEGAGGTVGEQAAVAEKAPAEEETEEIKVVERPVSQSRLNMPVLMDSAGVAMSCFYHAGADAVNLCSRCKQYVCAECNYITGTNPICHNCWDKRAERPIAPPPQKVSPARHKAEKPKTAKVAEPEKQEKPEPEQPEAPVLVEPAMPVEPLAPIEPAGPIEAVVAESAQQKIVASSKTAKLDAEKSQWQQEFMALYQQTLPIINVIISRGADNMPASPLDLMEGLKLRPMLERAKKLSKPKDKELRSARSEFEQILSICIKIADSAANFVSGGGQALLGGPDFKRIVNGIETANGLIEKLSQKVAAFPQTQE